MHSRSFLLLEREYRNLKTQNELWGINVHCDDENLFQWVVYMSGLKTTEWENGVFTIRLNFNEHFDEEWPLIIFETIPFHPNIDPYNGKPCLDIINSKSSKEPKSIAGLLLQIQALLSNPVLDNAVNIDAVNLLVHSPAAYTELVDKCVVQSQRLYNINQGFVKSETKAHKTEIFYESRKETIKNIKLPIRPKPVSFDEYHKNWMFLGTSYQNNTFVYSDNADGRKMSSKMNTNQRDRSVTPSASRAVAMDTEQRLNKKKVLRMERLSAMKKLYMNKAEDLGSSLIPPVTSRADVGSWDQEAEKLVAWTTGLDENKLQ